MCIYTVKKQILILKGMRNSTERPKIRRFWRKGYRKKPLKIYTCLLNGNYSQFYE